MRWSDLDIVGKWAVGFGAAVLALIGILAISSLVGVLPEETVTRVRPAKVSKPKLTDAEVQAKWDAQVRDAQRALDAASESAADTWGDAKMKFKRLWVEGQDQ